MGFRRNLHVFAVLLCGCGAPAPAPAPPGARAPAAAAPSRCSTDWQTTLRSDEGWASESFDQLGLRSCGPTREIVWRRISPSKATARVMTVAPFSGKAANIQAAVAGPEMLVVVQSDETVRGIVPRMGAAKLFHCRSDEGCKESPLVLDRAQRVDFLAADSKRGEIIMVGPKAVPDAPTDVECCVPTRIAICAIDGSRCASRTFGATGYEDEPLLLLQASRQLLAVGEQAKGGSLSKWDLDDERAPFASAPDERETRHAAFSHPEFLLDVALFEPSKRTFGAIGVLARDYPATPTSDSRMFVACPTAKAKCAARPIGLRPPSNWTVLAATIAAEHVVTVGTDGSDVRLVRCSLENLLQCSEQRVTFDDRIAKAGWRRGPGIALRAEGPNRVALLVGDAVAFCAAGDGSICSARPIVTIP